MNSALDLARAMPNKAREEAHRWERIVLRIDLAWAAGFFDGEGTTTAGDRIDSRTKTKARKITVSAAQSDRERLDHLASVLGVGNVRGPYAAKGPNSKPYHVWSVASFQAAQHCVCLMWNWLGSEKRKQAAAALRKYHAFEPKECEHGIRLFDCRTCCSARVYKGWATRKEAPQFR